MLAWERRERGSEARRKILSLDVPVTVMSNRLTSSDKKPVCRRPRAELLMIGLRLGRGMLEFFLSPILCVCVHVFV